MGIQKVTLRELVDEMCCHFRNCCKTCQNRGTEACVDCKSYWLIDERVSDEITARFIFGNYMKVKEMDDSCDS